MVATTDENKGVISVNKDDLTWVAFYSEFAGKLLPFANDRKTLIEKVKAVYTANNMTFSELEKDNAVVDIDPFTVFGLFNKGIKDADRIALLQGFAKAFSVNAPVPASFSGIPVLNDQKAAFSSFIGDRKDNDIQTLWEVFLSAMEYAETHSENSKTALIKAYDAALLQKGIEWNLTTALHWIRPYEYISLDSRNRRYISNPENMPSDFISSLGDFSSVPSGEQYLQINDRCRGLLEKGDRRCKNFPELSYCAWTASEVVNEGNHAVTAAKSQRSNVGEAIGEKNVDSRRYWLYQPGKNGKKWDEFYGAGIMAYHRGEIGDLTAYPSMDAMKKKMKECIVPNNAFNEHGPAAWNFANVMKPGDVVFVKKGMQKMVGRGIITSDYIFDPSRTDEFKNIRKMNWTNKGEWDHPGPKEAPSKWLTDITPKKHYLELMNALFEDDAGEEIEEVEIQPQVQEMEIQPEVPEALTASEDVNEGDRAVAAAKSQRSNVGEAIGEKNVDSRRYWLYSPGDKACKWDEFYDAGLMAIGWPEIGDLTAFPSKDAMRKKMKECIDPNKSFTNDGLATWEFANVMKPGDVVFAKKGVKKLVGRGIVTSDYMFDASHKDEYKNIRRVNWTNKGEWDHTDLGFAPSKTLTDETHLPHYIEQLNALFEDDAGEEIKEVEIQPQVQEVEIQPQDYTPEDFLNEVYMSEADYQRLVNLLKHKKNIILQGAPGVGKTFAAKRLAYSMMGVKDSSRVMMVQFHQSYSYEDFIMGFRPASTGFELKEGPFYSFCKKAEMDSDKDYFFIIDEINRGNLSKIFGELMMLIENDKRGVPLQLLYSNEKFSVPENVHIIGMMNTADRSLAMMDYALRRRFAFFEISPAFDTEGFRSYLEGKKNTKFNNLIAAIIRLNEDIEKDETLGRGFCIGHSYFCTENAIDDMWLKAVVNYEILPLLNEYWFDEPDKVEDWESKLHQAIQ